MACIPTDITVDKATRASLAQDIYGKLNEKSSQAERLEVLDKINNEYYPKEGRIIEVLASEIDPKRRQKLGLIDDNQVVSVYRGFLKRTTDATKELFVRSKGATEAMAMSLEKNNIIKRETGTKLHNALEDIMNSLISMIGTEGSKYIMGSSDSAKTATEIRLEYGLTQQQYNNLEHFVKTEIKNISNIQKNIDPNGQAKILTEVFIPDFTKDSGGTVDLMVVYSDSTGDILDYKTIYPKVKRKARQGRFGNKLLDGNVIPGYKIQDITTQMRINKDAVLRNNILKEVRRNRAIPIHASLKYIKGAPEGANLKPDINYLAIGKDQDPALTMISVDELTGVKAIDKTLVKMKAIESNYQKLVNEGTVEDRAKWMVRLERVRKSINKIIVDRDMDTMMDDVKSLLNRYYDRVSGLKDIQNEIVGGKINPSYLSENDLNELIGEFQAYSSILGSAHEFLMEIGVTDRALIDKYLDKRDILLGSVDSALNMMKNLRNDKVMTKEEKTAMQDSTSVSFWQRLFRTLGQQINPVFKSLNDKLQTAFNKARLDTQVSLKTITGWDKRLDEVGKAKGLSRREVYRMLLSSSKNLHGKFKKELYDEIKSLVRDKKVNELDGLIELKDNAETLRTQYRQRYIQAKDPSAEQLADWDADHNFANAKISERLWKYYYQAKDNSDFYTDGYKVLTEKGNETLLEFWQYWQDTMGGLREKAGIGSYEKIPNNFVPWIRQDVIDMAVNGQLGFQGVREWADGIMNVKEGEDLDLRQSNEYIDPDTGAFKREVPLAYINPIHNAEGEIDSSLKSIDLIKSLYVFTETINKYSYLKNEVEPHVEALKDVLIQEGQKIQDEEGRDKVTSTGVKARLTGKQQDLVSLFDQYVNYHLYGLKIQDVQASTAKFWLNMKSFQQKKELAFSVLAPIGNFFQVRAGAYFEGLKGYFYKTEHLNRAQAMSVGLTKDRNVYNALRYFFEANSDISNVNAKNLSMTAMQRWVNWDTGFIGYRLGEHGLVDNVTVAMLMNYGFDGEGNIKRLDNLPKGTKSLFDGVSMKDDTLHIEGFMDKDGNVDMEKYTHWRNKVIAVGREIKGGLTTQDMQAVNMTMIGSLFMSFKNWMPGMIDARISRARYDYALDAVVEGKYTGILTDMGFMEGKADGNKSMFHLITTGLLPSLGKLMLDVATFGWLHQGGTQYKVNKQRAEAMFEAFKAKSPNTKAIQEMTFEDFLAHKQGQMRSAAAELFAIISLIGMVAYLVGKDDDDEPRYKSTIAGRNAFRIMNRAKREIAFFFDFESMSRSVLRQPIPVMGLLEDMFKWGRNTRDELGDLIYGEDEVRKGLSSTVFGANRGKDTKPIGYHTTGFIPGNKFFRVFEIFETDQDKVF